MTKRIGLLGGTFNPIHFGHLLLAEEAKERLELEKIIFIPSHTPPQRKEENLLEGHHRYEMVRLAVRGNPDFVVSDIEIQRGGPSYTIDTVRALRQEMPDTEFVLLIGSDRLQDLKMWKEIDSLFRLCRFVIAERPKFPLNKLPDGIEKLDIPQLDISSQELRQRIREGRSIATQVPGAVEDYILTHKLYR